MAAGGATDTFGKPGIEKHAIGLKDLSDLPKIEDLADVLGFGAPAGLADAEPATGLLPLYGHLFEGFKPSAGFPRLDPLSPKRGKHSGKWNLLINYRLDQEGWRY